MAKVAEMPAASFSFENSSEHRIEYLSPPAKVSMADQWFEVAPLDHFWVRRRFEVLQRLAGPWISDACEIAEIGCGHGLLQRQIEDAYGRSVTGFDLNEIALKQNLSRHSKVCCYDIFRQDALLREKFDVIFLFDVLEHIAEENGFLQALLCHLAPGGRVVVNVPAGQWAFSSYDRAAGHMRRYSLETLNDVAGRNNLDLCEWSYWGFPLVPVLALRKLFLRGKSDQQEVITAGFASRTPTVNKILTALSAWESIPQRLLGTSLMAVFQVRNSAQLSAP
jgi:SAM-dependent methyltransferase